MALNLTSRRAVLDAIAECDRLGRGAFLTLYPVMRIIGEQYRVGDTPAVVLGHEVSKGVLYSIPMFLAGAIYWLYWIRKDRRVPWTPPNLTTDH